MTHSRLSCISKHGNNIIHNMYELKKSTSAIRSKNKYLSFDSSIHNTLSDFNKVLSIDKNNIMELYRLLEKNWYREGYESLNEEQQFKFRAYRILCNYFYDPLDIGNEDLLVNKNLNVRINKRNVLFGRVDKIYERTDRLIEVVDYKSGYVINHVDNFKLKPKEAVIMYLTNSELGIYPDVISYYYLNYNRKLSHLVTKHDISNIPNLMSKILNKTNERRISSGE